MWGNTQTAFVLSAVLTTLVGSLFHPFRAGVPAYDKWGAHAALCNTPGPAPGTTEIEDPVSAFTSILYVVAASDSPSVGTIAAVLAAASFMHHAYETDGSRALDYCAASSMPFAIALLEWPSTAAVAVLVAFVLQYEVGVDYEVVAAVGGGAVAFNAGRLCFNGARDDAIRGPDISDVCAALLLFGAAWALRGGPRNDAICTNNRALAYAHDSRHGGWHVTTAALIWLLVAMFQGKAQPRPIAFAAAAAVPALALLADRTSVGHEAWLAATVVSMASLVAVAFVPSRAVVSRDQFGFGVN